MVFRCCSYTLLWASTGMVTLWVILLHLDHNCNDRLLRLCPKNYRMKSYDYALCDILCTDIYPCVGDFVWVKVPQTQGSWEIIRRNYETRWRFCWKYIKKIEKIKNYLAFFTKKILYLVSTSVNQTLYVDTRIFYYYKKPYIQPSRERWSCSTYDYQGVYNWTF